MKQKLLLLIALVMSSMGAWATPAYVNGDSGPMWEYDSSTKTLTISGTGDLTLPGSSYYSAPWYYSSTDIENVVVGDGITSIGDDALSYLSKATSFTIGSGVTSIGRCAFYWNNATSFTLPEGLLTIGLLAFSGCSYLENINIPSTVTSIDEGAFGNSPCAINVAEGNTKYCSECGVLFDKEKTILYHYPSYTTTTSYTIPTTVTTIISGAFDNCKLTSITIPANVTKIGNSAFYNSALETVVIEGANNTLEIEDWAFRVCVHLTTVTCYRETPPNTPVQNGIVDIENGMYEPDVCSAFGGCNALTYIYVPSASVSAYQSATGWSLLSPIIYGIDDVAVHEGATGEYWSTYYNSNFDMQAPAGTTVYAATLSGTTLTLVEISDRIVKAGEGVILKCASSENITLTTTETVASGDYTNNALKGVDVATAQTSGTTYYVLGYKDSHLAFYKYKSDLTLGAHKAYIPVTSDASREYIDINIDGLSTGISVVEDVKGKMDGVFYDLSGRRVLYPTKGLYIMNGKKVIIK